MRFFLTAALLLTGAATAPVALAQTKGRPAPTRKAPVRTQKAGAARTGVRTTSAAMPKPGAFARTKSGIEYQLYRKNAAGRYQPRPLAPAGDAPYASRVGELLTIHVQYRTGRDSLLLDSRPQQPLPQPFMLAEKPKRGSLEEGLSLLLPGDSAVFRYQADSIFAKTFQSPAPPFLKRAGNTFLVYVSSYQLLTTTEAEAYQQKAAAAYQQRAEANSVKQMAIDEKIIQDYLSKNPLGTAQKTPGGTYYVITQPGTGPLVQAGQVVSVLYRGTLLATGKEFDATARRGNQPFSFPLGQGQVIKGWDQGIAMLNKGAKVTLLIPSPLGYGQRGAGADIPSNAVLRFDVELLDFK